MANNLYQYSLFVSDLAEIASNLPANYKGETAIHGCHCLGDTAGCVQA